MDEIEKITDKIKELTRIARDITYLMAGPTAWTVLKFIGKMVKEPKYWLAAVGIGALIVNTETLKINMEDSYLRWRPELFAQIDSIYVIAGGKDRQNIDSLMWVGNFKYKNTGGSPAIRVLSKSELSKYKPPYLYKQPIDTSVHFTVFPGEVIEEKINRCFKSIKGGFPQYFHKVFTYKDRKGKRYYVEYVFYIILTPRDSIITERDGIYPGEYSDSVRFKPDNAEAHYDLGVAHGKKGETDEAIKEYREAIRLKPDLAEAHYNLALSLEKEGKTDEAMAEYREVIRLDPNDAAAHNNHGVLLGKQGKTEEEIAEYHEAIRLNPNYGLAYFNLGNTLKKQGKTDNAIAEYREAVRLMPDDAKALEYLAITLDEKGERREARVYWERALKAEKEQVGLETIKKRLAEPD